MQKTLEVLVNPFGNKESDSPDNIKKPEFEKNEAIDRLLQDYRPVYDDDLTELRYQGIKDKVRFPYLSPTEINHFMQRIFLSYERDKIEMPYTGIFISELINESENMELALNALDYNIPFLSSRIDKPYWHPIDRPVSIILEGNAERGFGSDSGVRTDGRNKLYYPLVYFNICGNAHRAVGIQSSNCKYLVEGWAGGVLGSHNCFCEYIVNGNVGDYCGKLSTNSKFYIKGNAGDNLGFWSRECEYIVEGRVGNFIGIPGEKRFRKPYSAENCVFKTPNKETYRKLWRNVPKNEVILMSEKEIKELKCKEQNLNKKYWLL